MRQALLLPGIGQNARSQFKQKFRRARRARHDFAHRFSPHRTRELSRAFVLHAPTRRRSLLLLLLLALLSLLPRLQRLLRLVLQLFQFRSRAFRKALPAASREHWYRRRRPKPNDSRRRHVIASNHHRTFVVILGGGGFIQPRRRSSVRVPVSQTPGETFRSTNPSRAVVAERVRHVVHRVGLIQQQHQQHTKKKELKVSAV